MLEAEILKERCAGVLLHITSLPSATGLGDFGTACPFIDFLAAAGMRIWQVLPLGPTHKDLSPYLCTSSFAGNPYLIDPGWLQDRGWLSNAPKIEDAASVSDYRDACLNKSFAAFQAKADARWREKYNTFVDDHNVWLDGFALFTALWRDAGGRSWDSWEATLKHCDPKTLVAVRDRLANQIAQVKFEQFIFYTRWHQIKQYANEKGIHIFGDMPLFVAHDSAEVWLNRQYFKVDNEGHAQVVAGVPPDYFSKDGQKWGNPVFDWEQLRSDGFQWWVNRLKAQLELCDLLRIDHFRGLEACWEIPAEAESAKEGSWRKTPGFELLQTLKGAVGELPVVAEDLGFITDEVNQLREQFNLPGMKVMQFAFDGSADNPYLVQNHVANCVAYTGTHDNNTTLGWYQSLGEDMQVKVDQIINRPQLAMPWSLIDYTLSSPAKLVVLPMQDILSLGGEHRLNVPGTAKGNWQWQFSWQQVDAELPARLHQLLLEHHRTVNVSSIV